MPDKKYWIRKYEYRKEIQNLYLIIDITESDGNKYQVIYHKIKISEDSTTDDPFTHKSTEDEFESDPKVIERIVDRIFRDLEQTIIRETKSNNNIKLEIETVGEGALAELQYTPFFNDLKKTIMREKMSDSFKSFLEQLDQGPIIGKTEWS